ncbi:MAG TPA: hypothetical protein VFW62_02755, partial [bacterium]|nr:hypothetical protein [bacterium]
MRARRQIIAILGLALGLSGRLQAAGPQFPAQDFPQVQSLLCSPAANTSEAAARNACQLESYTVVGADLKGDGSSIWLFYGPSVECGAHGNCPLALLQKQGDKWKPLSSEACQNEDCLNFGNPTFSQVLKTSHQG